MALHIRCMLFPEQPIPSGILLPCPKQLTLTVCVQAHNLAFDNPLAIFLEVRHERLRVPRSAAAFGSC